MSDKTPNGFSVLEPGSDRLDRFEVNARTFVVRDNCVKPFTALVTFFDLAVEGLDEEGWEGGYAHRYISGTQKWSEHAAGTAIDLNASQHGRGAASGFTLRQRNAIEWFLTNTASGRIITWGGHWVHKDWMHFEIKSPKALSDYIKQYG